MAGKSYIKVGYYDWDRIKKMYIKTGGQTWTAIRKSYVKTSTGWRKVFDTASNRPFIAGNDIPKIRLNTFRTGSSYNPSGTLDDPVDPVVEAPPVQQMGPSWTSPTLGWPYESLGRHLWGYDGTWTSGNGSSMTFTYTWLYNLTGNSNDNTPELNATSTTGRTDMLTNLSSHLGQSDGDYFDKNFLTFRVTATNSAGSASAESAPVYIVREVPTGSITMVSPGTATTNSSMSATFTYSNNWYNKTNVSNSYIEWFAVNSIGEALTNSNRVQIEYLSSIAATGTTTKSGTAFHTATIANKYYYVKMTLNNSGTENAVIAITGFTPKSSVTSQANKTVVTGAALTAPTSTSIVSMSRLNDTTVRAYIGSSGGSGPYYQLYWQSGSTAPSTTNYDAASNTSTVMEDFSFSNGITYYFYIRSSSENLGNTITGGTGTSGTYSDYGPATGAASYAFVAPSGATSSVSGSSTVGSTLTLTANSPTTAAPSASTTGIVWRVNDGGVGGNSFTGGSVLQSSGTTFVIPQFLYGSVSSVGYQVRAEVTWNNGVGSQTANSNTVTITAAITKLATPTGVNASDNRSDGVNVTWNAVSNAAYYGVWYGPTPSYDSLADFGGNRNTSLITGTSYLDTSLANGVTRDYYVQAYRSGDPTATKSDWAGPDSGTRTAAGTAPSGGSVTLSPSGVQQAGTTITANVTAMSGTATISYTTTLRKKTGSSPASSTDGTEVASGTGTGNVASHTITASEASGTPDQFRAFTTGSNSFGATTVISNTVISTPATVSAPGIPTSVSLGGSGVVAWTASTGSPTSYEIEFFTAQNGSGLNAAGAYSVTGIAGTSYQLVSPYASPNNWARVRVRARNSGGASSYSAWVPSETTYT
jgi:hypothetical protein